MTKDSAKAGGLVKAKRLFKESGLHFPHVPAELGSKLKERSRWCFSTRVLKDSPYNLDFYIKEGRERAP